ncbi:ras GEF [Panus rudis PR-1116 ss-1]|nr:ras GEF [Panus rudis PR-1116 ss-1]
MSASRLSQVTTTTKAKTNAVDAKRQLPRLAIDATRSSYAPPRREYPDSPASSISSARASVATSFETPSSVGIFHVLCLYDFKAADEDQLSFRKDDILDIVKQEDSGWWAAMRGDDRAIGWIPSAYVKPISEQTADRLRMRRDTVRDKPTFSTDAVSGRSNYSPLSGEYDPTSPMDGIRGFDWMPLSLSDPGAKALPVHLMPSDVSSPVFSPLSPLSSKDDDSGYTAEPEDTGQILELPSRLSAVNCPPSPMTPMPQPPPKPPLHHSRSMPLRSNSNPLPFCGSSSPQNKSNLSLNGSPVTRHLRRRRPVLIDDSNSLSRLSTLLESHNVDEVDFLAGSPVVADSIDAYSPHRSNRTHTPRSNKIKQIMGDDEAQAFHKARMARDTSPWYLRSDYGDRDIRVEPDGSVTAGTLPALVERLTTDPPTSSQSVQFQHAFLLTYKTFATPDEVFDLLLQRYYLNPPPDLTPSEYTEWKEKRLLPTQRKVLTVFIDWLEHHRLVQDDPPVAQRMQGFLNTLVDCTLHKDLAREAMRVLERVTFDIPASPTPIPPCVKRKKSKLSKDSLIKRDATALAEHLCLYDYKLYCKVRPQDCLDYVKRRRHNSSNLNVWCSSHDKVVSWVQSSILAMDTAAKRSETVNFWIKVAEKCKSLHNFGSLSAVLTALSSNVIAQLNLTWAYASRIAHFESLKKYNDPTGNFSVYRNLQQTVAGPSIPFPPVYLKDIARINEKYLDNTVITATSSTVLVNFVKRQKWAEVVTSMLQYQEKPYPFEEDPAMSAYIEANLAQAAEMEPNSIEFWKRSQELQQAEAASTDIRKGLEAAGF